MATIRCGNCGGTHPTVGEVRNCHGAAAPAPDGTLSLFADTSATPDRPHPSGAGASGDGDEPPAWGDDELDAYFGGSDGESVASDEPADALTGAQPRDARPSSVAHRRPRAVVAKPVDLPPVEVLAGPPELGRWALVAPGQPAPDRWGDAPRVSVDGADGDAVEELHRAWLERRPLIIELHDWPEPDVIDVTDDPLHTLDPGFDLVADRIRFLLRNHAVDVRHPAQPRFWPAELAIAGGAEVGTATDVRLADGTPAWADGGPPQASVVAPIGAGGAAVVSWVALERGLLKPLQNQVTSADLAADQLAAVSHDGGGARVVAPAGSGKTRVLTERARHLIRDRGVPAQAICLVAFNKRASEEIAERTTDLPGLQIRTLNALGFAICRGAPPFQSHAAGGRAGMVNERDVRQMLDRMVTVRRKSNTDPMAAWIDALSQARLGLRDPNEVEDSMGGEVQGFGEVFFEFRQALADRGQLDFDEQIVRACELLLGDPQLRDAAQRACRILLVDEFQDLTPAHLLFIRLLGAPGFDVFGVGDDDQTIYGYTGASPRWLLDFDTYVPGAGKHALEVNYRCAPGVVSAADCLLSHNRQRVDKRIRPAPGRTDAPTDLVVVTSDDTTRSTVDRVGALMSEGAEPQQIAVLTRVNATLAAVQVALADSAIPVVKTVDANLLSRTGMRASLCWLRLAVGPERFQAADIAEAARRPGRGLSPRVVGWMGEQRDLAGLGRLANRLKDRDTEKVATFAADLTNLRTRVRGATTAEVLQAVRDEVGLSSALDSLDGSKPSVAGSTHGDDLEALIGLARLQPDPELFEPWLRDHLSNPGAPAGKGVMLATIHRVKGLEWPHVIVHEVASGIMPHRLSTQFEEERRVFHVGITRSSGTTAVVSPRGAVSPFVSQLQVRHDPTAPVATPSVVSAGRDRSQPKSTTRGAVGDEGRSGDGAVVANPELREALRQWRLEESRSRGVPAYQLFGNKTLDEIANRVPKDRSELIKCNGIGHKKLDDFGTEVLAVIAEHC